MAERPAAPTPRASNLCRSFAPGHAPHWIPGIHSLDTPRWPRRGDITAIERGVITIDFEGEVRRYRNHALRRLRALVKAHGPAVVVDEGWWILRMPPGPNSHCFNVVRSDSRHWASCKRIADGLWPGMF